MKLLYDSHASEVWAEPFLRLPTCTISQASRKDRRLRETAGRAKLRTGMCGAFTTWSEFGVLRAHEITDDLFQRDVSGYPQETADLFQREG